MSEKQCPTCGRVRGDWTDRGAHGGTVGPATREDRTLRYRLWRRTLGGEYCVSDVDQVEWRRIDGRPTPRALVELSRVDGDTPLPPSYLATVLERWHREDGQGRVLRDLAARLGLPLYLVLFRWDLQEWWLWSFRAQRWRHLTGPEPYAEWIRHL